MKALSIRNVDARLARALEREQRRRGTSLNQTVIDLLNRALGLDRSPRSNGLGALADKWSEDEFEEFTANTRAFERIDAELWK